MNLPQETETMRALDALWQKLASYKIVEGSRPGITTLETPWYIKALLALSGWVAAVFLIGFVGSVFVFVIKHAFASIALGAVFIAVAFSLLKRPNNEFVSHLALAISLAGQGFILWGVLEPLHDSPKLCALIITLLEILLTIVMPSFIHRVFSSFIAACGLYIGLAFVGSDDLLFSPTLEAIVIAMIALFMSWIWLNEFKFPGQINATTATGYGLTLALLVLKSTALFGDFSRSLTPIDRQSVLLTYAWLGEALLVAVLIFVVTRIIANLKDTSPKATTVAIIGALVLGLASIKAPGIVIGVLITLLGFHNRNLVLQSLGVVALLGYVSRYYYFLDYSLASKAGILFLVGCVLLTVRFFLSRVAKLNVRSQGGN